MGIPTAVSQTLGWLGTAMALILFVVPLKTMKTIIADRDIGPFSPTPYLASLANCTLWSAYAMLNCLSPRPDTCLGSPLEPQVIACNGPGVFLQIAYVLVFVRNMPAGVARRLLVFKLATVLVACALFIGLCAGFGPTLVPSSDHAAADAVGYGAAVQNVIMYGSPLNVMATVIRTKSVRAMPFLLSLLTLVCSGFWFGYSFLVMDLHILIPNCLGLLFGVAQLVLYATYYDPAHFEEGYVPPPDPDHPAKRVGGGGGDSDSDPEGAAALLREPLTTSAGSVQ